MVNQIGPAMTVVGSALKALAASDLPMEEKQAVVRSNITCDGRGEVRWWKGETLFQFLKNVNVQPEDGTAGLPLSFQPDGSRYRPE